MDAARLAMEERADLAAFLESLSPEQWESPTLCAGWRVRDVVAHVISYEGLGFRDVLSRFVRGRFRPDRVNDLVLAEYGDHGPEEILALLRARLRPRGLTAAFGGMIALVDCVIHHQDIRRPLGLPRSVPEERLRPALRGALGAPVIRGFSRTRGLRLVATDLDWSLGRGPEVRGTAEALLMAIAGRRGVVAELSGPGQPVFARRVGG
ncbi:maleylpyruvate isomerase family mycothiol-dependent enzyme [Amycolatopsis cynarae]|uniref:Maleylpyruvate isomerase family mycothiol-dependent enzyme n=1 Tax=Amycolatopsis cynarae TaxID=2995223 RepID=A0ABY7B4W4_9PSEU|nr:maleylpyruvate isomerase family mycothiol-dependent enzyme [Amycolatopsis sp. HUAS 11-8]WAL65843.1 maleylpyruvate isomerase family mycothiol-dependent enzyme [Amycolatopsis sp. HUAS 11-8]